MRLDADGIYLTPPSPDRAEDLLEAIHESVASVGAWLPWCTPDYGRAEALEWIARADAGRRDGSAFELSIFDAATDEILGSCSLNQIDATFRRGNLGYWIRESRQGGGLATRAARRVAEFGFAERGLYRIEIVAAVGNIASQQVAEKTGATREAVLRNRLVADGKPVDAVMFSLIPADLR